MLLLFVVALSFSISTAFAADNTTKTTKTSQNLAAGSPAATTFTSAQINTAAGKVKTYTEKNKKLPNYVTIKNKKVTMPQFMKLMAANTINLNGKKAKSVTVSTVKSPLATTEKVKSGNLAKSQYVNLAQKINTHINKYSKAPNYVNTSRGKISFNNLVYSFSKVLKFNADKKRLPNTVSVKPWSVVSVKKVSSEGSSSVSGLRPVYIMSDNINGKTADKARINKIVSELKKLGAKAYLYSIGPNSPKALLDKKVPKNALVVYIYGGACAGTIKETSSKWYKSIKGDRKVYFVWTEGAKEITGLKFLERAHDDNFSPYSFKGLSNPDKFLKSNGYQFIENYTNSQASKLAKTLFAQAKS